MFKGYISMLWYIYIVFNNLEGNCGICRYFNFKVSNLSSYPSFLGNVRNWFYIFDFFSVFYFHFRLPVFYLTFICYEKFELYCAYWRSLRHIQFFIYQELKNTGNTSTHTIKTLSESTFVHHAVLKVYNS